jgi:hypothetical protein
MKHEHTAAIVVVVGVGLAVLIWWTSGAASGCGFLDTIMGKCGAA